MKSLVNKDEIHVKAKMNNTIKEMFTAKFSSMEKAEIDKLEKEERLDKKKRLQQGWKIRRAHHERLHWAKEWIVDTAISEATELGHAGIRNCASSLVEELMLAIPGLADEKSSLRMARLERSAEKTKALRMKIERRNKAEKEKIHLMKRLEELWSQLEAGVPEARMHQEAHSNQEEQPQMDGKRKRETRRREKITMRDEASSRRIGREISTQLVEEILLGMEREHDCGISPACPAWLCEKITNRLEMEKEIEKLSVDIITWKIEEEDLEMELEVVPTEEENLCEKQDRLATHPLKIQVVKSPVGELIKLFENNLDVAIPPAKKTLIEEFRKLGITTKQVDKIKSKFEEKPTK